MTRALRIIAWTVGSLLLLILAAAVIIPLVVDPNDYRDEIGALVSQRTGREFSLDGDIALSIFPWLGIETGAWRLGNAKGFGPEPFAQASQAQVRVRLVPLLRGSLEVDTVVIDGLRLRLARDAAGRNNWDDLLRRGADSDAPAERTTSSDSRPALAVEGIRVRDARVHWNDAASGRQAELNAFTLETGRLDQRTPFPLKLATNFSASTPALRGHLALTATVTLDLAAERYTVSDIEFSLDAQGAVLPGGRVDATVHGDARVDLRAQQASWEQFDLSIFGLRVQGAMEARQILDAPALSGGLSVAPFVPRDLIGTLGAPVPETADPGALTRATANLRFSASMDGVDVKDLTATLDQTTLTGTASVQRFDSPVVRYDLAVDRLDADRYLPPPSSTPTPPATGAATAPLQLPHTWLRKLDVEGTLRIGQFKAANLRTGALHTTLRGSGGRFRLHPLGATLYGGRYEGDLALDVRKASPVLTMNEKLSGVQVGPLLKDFLGKDYVTGTVQLEARLRTTGTDAQQLRRGLNGKATFAFRDGAVNGLNIAQLLREALATYNRRPAPPKEARRTDFAELSGSLTVTNGVVHNRDLAAKSPLFRIHGQGEVNLVTEAVDYRVDTSLVRSLEGQGGRELQDLAGLTVPIRIGGRLTRPTFDVALGELVEDKAQQALEAERKKAQDEAARELDKRKQQVQKDLENRLKDLLPFQ